MKRIVERAIPNSGITQQGLFGWVRDIILPVLKEIRQVVNSRFGQVTIVYDDYTFTELDECVIADTYDKAVSIYLPPIASWTKIAIVKRVGPNTVTIYPNPVDSTLIDNGAWTAIATSYVAYQFITDGDEWYKVSSA